MSGLKLAIVYRPVGGRPYQVAVLEDADLIQEAAARVVARSERRAEAISRVDEALGRIELAESERLKSILAELLPLNRSAESQYVS